MGSLTRGLCKPWTWPGTLTARKSKGSLPWWCDCGEGSGQGKEWCSWGSGSEAALGLGLNDSLPEKGKTFQAEGLGWKHQTTEGSGNPQFLLRESLADRGDRNCTVPSHGCSLLPGHSVRTGSQLRTVLLWRTECGGGALAEKGCQGTGTGPEGGSALPKLRASLPHTCDPDVLMEHPLGAQLH